jgi:hypothetical protein
VREVAALAQLRDLELDHPHPGVPLTAPVAVALGHPPLRVALAKLGADQLRHLRLHQLLHHQPHRLAQHIGVLAGHHLPGDLLNRHALGLGHRGCSPFVDLVEQTDDHGRRGGRNRPQDPEIPATETLRHPRRGPQNGLQRPVLSWGTRRFRPTASHTTLWDVTAAGVGSPSLPVLGVLSLPLPVAAVLGSGLVPVRLLPAAVVVGQVFRVLLLPAPHAPLQCGARPSFRERARLNSARGFSSPHSRAALQVIRGRRRPRWDPA